jgi:hypothetical protein
LIVFKLKAGQNCWNTTRNIFTHARAYITFKVSNSVGSKKIIGLALIAGFAISLSHSTRKNVSNIYVVPYF